MHRSMCGLYSQAPEDIADTLNDSAQRDVVRRMVSKQPSDVRARQFGKAWVLEFPVAAWEASLHEICDRWQIDVQMGCSVIAVQRQDARISGIQIGDPIESWIGVKAIVDCTGGGHVLRLAGDDAYLPKDGAAHRMLAGFSMRLNGLTGDPEIQRLQTAYALAKGVEKGALPPLARFTAFYPGPTDGEGVCKIAVNPVETITDEAQTFANQIVNHLKREIAGFAGAGIVEISPRILPRDGLRLRGRYVVTEQDILQAKKHGSDAVHAWWPIEKWDLEKGPTYEYPAVGEHYDIPYHALRSAAIENLFAAGTCISATADAAASTRASGICLATGDAAGRLAVSLINH